MLFITAMKARNCGIAKVIKNIIRSYKEETAVVVDIKPVKQLKKLFSTQVKEKRLAGMDLLRLGRLSFNGKRR